MRPNVGFELLKINFRNTYFRSPKGLLFAIVPPAGSALFFTAPQGLYVWYYTAAWLLFATLVLSLTCVITSDRTIYERYPIPVHSFLYFPILRAIVNFTISYFVLVFMLRQAGFPPTTAALVNGYILLLPLGALGVGLGLVFSVFGLIYRWNTAFPLLLLSSIVLWKLPPLTALITFPANAFLDNMSLAPGAFTSAASVSFLFLALSIRFFYITQIRLYKKCL